MCHNFKFRPFYYIIFGVCIMICLGIYIGVYSYAFYCNMSVSRIWSFGFLLLSFNYYHRVTSFGLIIEAIPLFYPKPLGLFVICGLYSRIILFDSGFISWILSIIP